MAQGIITKIEHNQSFTSKAGKQIDCSILHWTSEGGKASKDRILPFGDSEPDFKLLQTLAPSDKIEIKMKKLESGAWVTMSGTLKLVEKGNGEVPKPTFGVTSSQAKLEYKESPEKQASIQRQNALSNATNLISAMLGQEMYKKTTKVDLLVDEILKIADRMYGYTSGTTAVEAITSTVPDVKPDKQPSVDEEEMPF